MFEIPSRNINQKYLFLLERRKIWCLFAVHEKYTQDMDRFVGRCLLILAILCGLLYEHKANSDRDSPHLRRKRYVVFPEGSSFSIALCMTVHTLTPDNIFTEGVNWGISYDLPNESKPALEPFLQLRNDRFKSTNKYGSIKNGLQSVNKNAFEYTGWNVPGKYVQFSSSEKKRKGYKANYYYIQRRHRRDLYNKLEVIMNSMGFDGRSCVLRALCEASQRLMPKGNTLVEEMMRISFSLPLKKVFSFEPEEHRMYTNAHKAGHEGQDCIAMFPGCSFSLIDMALGKYNAPSGDYTDVTSYHPSHPVIPIGPSGTYATDDDHDDDVSENWTRYNMK
ncbi:uncharacterized protein LOC118449571 isoform X1 [Vespa mandarinia]|uniref:uncharacterized protein LOC118449571 isoform X1 n=2 Tax=Vespa mandarinia TaxID=7446 RepID=UPI001610FAD3|nr:uncharacterized protein LOC118449571 isoform X1 [Vespa mandarinia]